MAKTKNKGGRPKEKPGDKCDLIQVEKLAGLGMTDIEIGYVLGVTEQTVNNWKTDEGFLLALKTGKAKANSRVVESLYKRALGYEYEEVTYEAMRLNSTSLPSVTTTPVKVKTVVKHIEPNPTAMIFWLKNRQPDRWRDVKDGVPDKPPADHDAKIDKLIADAEARAERAGAICH